MKKLAFILVAAFILLVVGLAWDVLVSRDQGIAKNPTVTYEVEIAYKNGDTSIAKIDKPVDAKFSVVAIKGTDVTSLVCEYEIVGSIFKLHRTEKLDKYFVRSYRILSIK